MGLGAGIGGGAGSSIQSVLVSDTLLNNQKLASLATGNCKVANLVLWLGALHPTDGARLWIGIRTATILRRMGPRHRRHRRVMAQGREGLFQGLIRLLRARLKLLLTSTYLVLAGVEDG